jgi:hypothetical protein
VPLITRHSFVVNLVGVVDVIVGDGVVEICELKNAFVIISTKNMFIIYLTV